MKRLMRRRKKKRKRRMMMRRVYMKSYTIDKNVCTGNRL